jgi:hypothetical protein
VEGSGKRRLEVTDRDEARDEAAEPAPADEPAVDADDDDDVVDAHVWRAQT